MNIKGEISETTKSESNNIVSKSKSTFSRQMMLPNDCETDPKSISASYNDNDGVLEIQIPISKENKTQKKKKRKNN